MRRTIQLGLLITLAATQLPAAEMANLRNGFSIRHESRENRGDITRLYLSGDGYVDVATVDIESFSAAPSDPISRGAAAPTTQNLAGIIGSASANSQIDADFIASVISAESGNN